MRAARPVARSTDPTSVAGSCHNGDVADDGTGRRPAWPSLLVLCVAAVLLGVSCGSADTVMPGTSAQAPPAIDLDPSVPFPRTATYFLEHNDIPTVDELARYDVVVLDNEWANRLPRAFFDELRIKNPQIELLAYVNLIDSVHEIGAENYWQNAYKLWQINSDRETEFPDEWLARTADGTPVHEWQDRVMANLTDLVPRLDGLLYVEYAVDWVAEQVWSSGVWDGIFLDVWGERIFSADSDRWDIDRDGYDDLDEDIYGPGKPLDRGLTIGEDRLRAKIPDAILVANGARTMRDGRLNGVVFENFADPAHDRDPAFDLDAYVTSAASDEARDPRLTMTINKQDSGAAPPDALRKARFEFVATLLQNGFWAPMGANYGAIEYYDEMDGGGLGKDYLGHALERSPTMDDLSKPNDEGTGSPAPGVFRRDFDNGIALLNSTDAPVEIRLESSYQKLRGTQDPVTNDGSRVDTVTVPAQDGIVLVR